MTEAVSFKDQGNEHFKAGRYPEALECYQQALADGDLEDLDRAIIFKNKAAVHLKMNNFQDAINDTTTGMI